MKDKQAKLLSKQESRRAFREVLTSKYSIMALIFGAFIFSLTVINTNKAKKIKAFLSERDIVDYSFVHGRFRLSRFQAQPGNTTPKVNIINPYKTVKSKAGGKRSCICPIDRVVYVDMQTCKSACPVCRKHLFGAVYGGDGAMKPKITTKIAGVKKPNKLPHVKL